MAENPFKGLSKGQKVAVGVGGAVTVFLVYRSYSKAKAASSANAATAAASPATVDPNSIDPTTGLPYGSAADTAALAAQSGVGVGGGTGYDPNAGYYNPVPTGSAPTTNSAWAQYVEQQLTSIGYDPQTVAAAIGRYLAKLPLTADQAQIVQVALAEAGPPPQGSYTIITTGGSTPASGGSAALPAPTGLRVSNKNAHEFSLAWNPVQGAHNYGVQVTQLNGVKVADFQVSGPGATVSSQTHPGFTYHVGVQALPGGVGTNITVQLPSK